MSKTLTLFAAVVALVTIAVTGSARAGAAQEPSTPIDTPGPAAGLGSGPGLGSRRSAPKPADRSGAFIYRKGRYIPLDGLPGTPTGHVGLNNRGRIVGGHAVDESTLLRGFVRGERGDYESFDAAPGAPDRLTTPFDINDRGTTVGAYAVGSVAAPESAAYHGFLRRPDGGVETVDVPRAQATLASGIDDRGTVVGTYADADGERHGFMRDARRRVTTIDPPGPAANGWAFDINDLGRIVGFYTDANGTYHGYLYHGGQFTQLDPPQAAGNRGGFGATAPLGINNRGQVVGQYVDADGLLHGYLWEPERGFRTIDPPRGARNSCADIPNVGRVCGTVAADINDRGEIVLPSPGAFFKGDGPN
jgi:probable HAF family extracellular repeat protein